MSYDIQSYNLAAAFLSDIPSLDTEANRNELAQLIQTTIEDFISFAAKPDTE
jgi:hypothetical protein